MQKFEMAVLAVAAIFAEVLVAGAMLAA